MMVAQSVCETSGDLNHLPEKMLVNSAAMRPSIHNVSFLKFRRAEKQCTVTVSNAPTSVSQLNPYTNNPTAHTNSTVISFGLPS